MHGEQAVDEVAVAVEVHGEEPSRLLVDSDQFGVGSIIQKHNRFTSVLKDILSQLR